MSLEPKTARIASSQLLVVALNIASEKVYRKMRE